MKFICVHYLSVLGVLLLLPLGDGAARFTKYPPSVLFVSNGGTARFVWDYHVDNKAQDFVDGGSSPIWFFDETKTGLIAVDDGLNNWQWTIVRQYCPLRLLNPTRVSKESTATLVIRNVTSVDDGTYGCALVLKTGPQITSTSTLLVTVPPQFTPQPPITKNIEEGQVLSLPCTAIGPPTPNVTWVKKEGHVIKSTGTGSATLSITGIRRDKNGIQYECQAKNNPNENPATALTMVNVYYSPQATVSSSSMTVKQGDEIVLRCSATGNPQPSLSWTKSGGTIKPGHTAAAGTLKIPGAIKTDDGKYICTANNSYGSKEHLHTAAATVVVQYQPSILLNILLKQKSTFNESDSLALNCEADGNPTPTFKWKTPSGSVHTGRVFNMATVSRSDAGTYTCIASNGIGTEVNASVQVTVQYKPVIDETRSSRTSESWNGNSIGLKCLAAGLPTPRISWYKPTTHQMATRGSEVTVLTTADPGDYGQYKCRASNIVGSDEHFINVTQLFPPGLVAITISGIEASSVMVWWTKPANDGGRPVTGYKIGINSSKASINKLNESLAVITKLDTHTKYLVNVYATSDVGDGNASTKGFTTLEQGKPGVPDLTVTLDTTKGLSVTLTWTKPDNNGGDITNYTIYMKEDKVSEWTRVAESLDPSVLEYTVTKNIEYGKKYKFLVTAWNEFGESENIDALAKHITMPGDPPTDPGKDPNKGKRTRTSGNGGSQAAIIAGSVGTVLLILIAAAILVVIFWKKGLLGIKRKPRSRRAAYHTNGDPDSLSPQAAAAAAANLGADVDDGIPTYAAIDMTKKKKKQNDIPDYAAVDMSKKKRPGEIIYADLADFNTAGAAEATPRPITYKETDYADISQFQKQDEPEPMYANFPGRSENFSNVQGM